MFTFIKHPITSIRVLHRIANEVTPEERAQLKSDSVTDEEKKEIAVQVVKRTYPKLAKLSSL
jgi:hypothetical protein